MNGKCSYNKLKTGHNGTMVNEKITVNVRENIRVRKDT